MSSAPKPTPPTNVPAPLHSDEPSTADQTTQTTLELADGWACWRPFALRGAGFPLDRVLRFADPKLLAALENHLTKETELRQACLTLIAAWSNGGTSDERNSTRQHIKHTHRLLAQLSTFSHNHTQTPIPPHSTHDGIQTPIPPHSTHDDTQTPIPPHSTHDDTQTPVSPHAIHNNSQTPIPSLLEASQAVCVAEEAWEKARVAWEAAFVEGAHREHRELQSLLAQGDLMRAVLWQNREAAIHGLGLIPPMASEEQNKRARQARQIVHRYLQRYCTKNDTIGFFGPVGWGFWSAGETHILAGSKQMARQGVYFEPWAMAVFARQWSESPAFLLDIPPRVHPLCALVEGRLLGVPGARGRDKSRALTPQEYALMMRCDARRTARSILADIAQDTSLFEDWSQAYQVLCDLVRKGWLIWSLDMAFEAHPERRLLGVVDALQDPTIQAACKKQLTPLLEAFDVVSKTTEDAASLAEALGALEVCFVAQSGESATRNQGATYAGRTLTYLDGQRDGRWEISDTLLGQIAQPLSLMLQSARWYTWRIATAYQAHLRGLCDQILATEGGSDLPLVRLWQEASDWLDPFFPKAVEEIVEDLQQRWATILDISESTDKRRLERDPAALKEAVMAAFWAPHPGWPCARHHAPDLMFAAPDLAALERGEGLFVLGELHAGIHPLCTLSMTTQHPDLASLQALYAQDIPDIGIAPIPDVDFARSCHDSRLAPRDLHLDMGAPWASWRGPDQVLPIGAFSVRPSGGGIEATTRDGQHRFDILQIIERSLKLRAAVHFSYLPSWAHRPRIQLGRLVIARESWRISAAQMAFARETQPSSRFAGASRWARSAEIPRFVFARSPKETKPIYVDFHSPPSVEIFCHLIRQAEDAALHLSEMLPSPEEAWLSDATGRRYVSEVRMIAVDPQVWRPLP
ncbi:lantibiotic dehydratase family protein [Myxococcota bacterium]|nr:lantibiotic dehydratase family protein [Myxococcota bacterium]